MKRDSNKDDFFALRLLSAFCPPQLYESIEGDLLEQFDEDAARMGKARAKRRLLINVIKFITPGIILRNQFSNHLMNTITFRSYFITALRNQTKNKVFSLINIFGLSIGIAACLLIFQF